MRIKEVPKVPIDTSRLTPVEERRESASSGNHNFQRHMSNAQTEEYEAYISDLTQKIYSQGELLGQRVDISEFQKYRELIALLFSETASNSYLFCKSDKFDSKGRHKVFAIIRNVNTKLDELAAMVLRNEADNIQLLNAVDDIRGMLVDMFL